MFFSPNPEADFKYKIFLYFEDNFTIHMKWRLELNTMCYGKKFWVVFLSEYFTFREICFRGGLEVKKFPLLFERYQEIKNDRNIDFCQISYYLQKKLKNLALSNFQKI